MAGSSRPTLRICSWYTLGDYSVYTLVCILCRSFSLSTLCRLMHWPMLLMCRHQQHLSLEYGQPDNGSHTTISMKLIQSKQAEKLAVQSKKDGKWVTIGSAWLDPATGKIGLQFGKKTRSIKGDKNSELVDVFDSITIKAGDKVQLFPSKLAITGKMPTHVISVFVEDKAKE